jgi:hypothetical protein
MRKMCIFVASAYEGNITASAEWKGKYSDWDDDTSSSSQAPAPQHEEQN